ncbi:PAS domain S-box protein, partial [bacterium]|nr:PAS domain S-box protein [bacterium]
MGALPGKKLEELRRRATDLLDRRQDSLADLSPDQIKEILQEIQVYQIELELQHEELQETTRQLEDTRAYLSRLYNEAPAGYLVLDSNGLIKRVNRTFETMTGSDSHVIGKAFSTLVVESDRPLYLARFRAFFKDPGGKRIDVWMKKADENPFHARLEAMPADPQRNGETSDNKKELFLIVSDITRETLARRRTEHLNLVLQAIRNVNQMIVEEEDPQRLIQRACENLTETMGYSNAWIALLDKANEAVTMTAFSGLAGGSAELDRQLRTGRFPACMRRALLREEIVYIEDPGSGCPDCPVAEEYRGDTTLAYRLAFGERVFGVLTVSLPGDYASDREEQALFEEVAGDIGFALQKIEDNREREHLRSMLERTERVAGVGSWEWDVATNLVNWSEELFNIFGLPPAEEAPSLEMHSKQYHPEDLPLLLDAIDEAVKNGTPYQVDLRLHRADGELRHVTARAIAEQDEAGKTVKLYGSLQDNTERVKAEEALARISSMASELICVADINTATFLQINPAFQRVLGYTESELLGTSFLDFIHPDDVQPTISILEDKLQKGAEVISFENRYICKDGSIRTLVWNSHPRPEEGKTYAIAHDITERKRAEEKLKESGERLKIFFEHSPISIWEEDFSAIRAELEKLREQGVEEFERYFLDHLDEVGRLAGLVRILDVNETSVDFFEADSKEDVPRQLQNYFTEASLPVFAKELATLADGGTRYDSEIPIRTPKGEHRILFIKLQVLPGHEESLSRILISFLDITERKQAEEALRLSEQRYRVLTDNFPNGALFLFDRNFRYLIANGKAFQQAELDSSLVVGRTVWEVFPELWDEMKPHHEAVFRGEETYYEVVYEGRLYSNYAVPIRSGEGRIEQAIVITQDITERRQAEEAVRKSEQKISSMFRAAPIGFGLVSNRVLLDINDQISEMSGYQRDELIGQSAIILYPDIKEFEKVGKEKYSQIGKFGVGTVETVWRRKDGSLIDILLSSSPI